MKTSLKYEIYESENININGIIEIQKKTRIKVRIKNKNNDINSIE